MHEIFTIESDSQSKISLHPGKVIRTHFLHIWDWLKVYPSYKDIFLLQGTRFSLEAMIGKKKTKKNDDWNFRGIYFYDILYALYIIS